MDNSQELLLCCKVEFNLFTWRVTWGYVGCQNKILIYESNNGHQNQSKATFLCQKIKG